LNYKLKDYYKIINGVIIAYLVIMLLLPLFRIFLSSPLNNYWQCSYKAITGENCPFCGITRDIESIVIYIFSFGKNSLNILNNITIPLLSLIAIETPLRTVLIIACSHNISKTKIIVIVVVDIIFHLTIFIMLINYIINFMR